MREKILVTGGAGFIGSHLVDALVRKGHKVKVLDNLEPQVHGNRGDIPSYFNKDAQFIKGDIRDENQVVRALAGIDIVFHLAAATGVGQSMYEIKKYMETNVLGTANLLNALVTQRHSVKKLILASSRAVYGEGKYMCGQCGIVFPKVRSLQQLHCGKWEIVCPSCGKNVQPLPTDEDKPIHPGSIYAITKRDQEEACLCVGQAYDIPTVVLRYFNVYGPRQSPLNPYTGIITIFLARILNNKPPEIYEDGLESRDFVYVDDVIQANMLVMNNDASNNQIFNVGTQRPLTILEVANILINKFDVDLKPKVVYRFRAGDIRHCYGDISKIQKMLGYTPKVGFEGGISDLILWAHQQKWIDLTNQAKSEMEQRGLTRQVYNEVKI